MSGSLNFPSDALSADKGAALPQPREQSTTDVESTRVLHQKVVQDYLDQGGDPKDAKAFNKMWELALRGETERSAAAIDEGQSRDLGSKSATRTNDVGAQPDMVNGTEIAQFQGGNRNTGAAQLLYNQTQERELQGLSSYFEVPGILPPNKSYIDPMTGRFYDLDGDGNIVRSGHDVKGSLGYAIKQAEHGGGAASFQNLNWRIGKMISQSTGRPYP
jgi:hypothetical protein